MKKWMVVLLVLLVSSGSAWAKDIVATWANSKGESMTLSARDPKHIRYDMIDGSYMLLTGDKTYSVRQDDGQWKALDLAQMAEMMKMFGGGAGKAEKLDAYDTKFKKLGRSEKHAGYKGDVYLVETRDEAGKLVSKEEAVFSKHKDILRINEAWATILAQMGSNMGVDTSQAMDQSAREVYKGKYGGVLRFGDDFKLIKVAKPALKASFYELPPGVQMEQMGSPQGVGQPPGSMGQPEEEMTEEETSTVEELKKGAGSLLKSIFK